MMNYETFLAVVDHIQFSARTILSVELSNEEASAYMKKLDLNLANERALTHDGRKYRDYCQMPEGASIASYHQEVARQLQELGVAPPNLKI